ncbi:hypothetical protein ACYULU_08150 [Breznakiellaceae bacterium SP9]
MVDFPRIRTVLLILSLCPVLCAAALDSPDSLVAKEAARREQLATLLTALKLPFDERPLFEEYGGFSSSLFVRFAANTGKAANGAFILAIPLTNAGESAESGFSFELALALIEKIHLLEHDMDILVAFLGDEVSILPAQPHRGLNDLLDSLSSSENAVLCYLDIAEPPQALVFQHGIDGAVAPLNILERIPALCAQLELPYTFTVRFNEIYKLGLIEGQTALKIAMDKDFNALYIGAPSSGTEKNGPFKRQDAIAAARIADFLVQYVLSQNFAEEDLDFHYSIVCLPFTTIFVTERQTVLALLAFGAVLCAVYLIYAAVIRHLLKKPLILLKQFWFLPVFVVCLILSLELSYLIVVVLRSLLSFPAFTSPLLGAFRLLFALLLLFFAPLISHIFKLPDSDDLYGIAATLLVVCGILLAAAIDITFVPIFLWALIFTLIGTLSENIILVFASALFIPFFALLVSLNIMELDAAAFGALLLSPDPFFAVCLSIIFLPSVLIFKKGMALFTLYKIAHEEHIFNVSRFERFFNALKLSLLFCSLAALSIVLFMNREDTRAPPERRFITERLISERFVLNERINLSSTETVFIGRRAITARLSAQGSPIRFGVTLVSADERPLSLYAARMPYEIQDGGHKIVFQLGEGPPNPFDFAVVLPAATSFYVQVEALYNRYDPQLDTQGAPSSSDYLLQVQKSYPFVTAAQ